MTLKLTAALTALALAAAGCATARPSTSVASGPARILIASDSTAADYTPDKMPQMGWGMVLKCSLDPGVEVVNLAKGGRSTKTYIEEGLWAALLAQLKPGDTVLIQFGHNDADRVKIVRFTEPDGAYADNLRRFVADIRAAGGQPVLVTPIARHMFEAGKVIDAHTAYAAAIRRVAAETGTPLVDLDADSMAQLQKRGEAESIKLYLVYAPGAAPRFPEGSHDTTHINEQGARLAAALVAKRLQGLNLPISARVHAASTTDLANLGAPVCPER
jgi:lysophospholipase L1-like esterase